MNEHDACIILNMLIGLGGLSAWKRRGAYLEALLKTYGGFSAILESDMASLSRVEGVSTELAGRIIRWRELVELDLELEIAKNEGVNILCRTDDEYPDSLRSLDNPPLCVYLLGSLPVDCPVRSVAIVGTRTPSDFGIRMARDF